MISLADSLPDLQVQDAEFARLLGYPHDWVLEGRALELARWARSWFADHGRPWMYIRRADGVDLSDDYLQIENEPFSSTRLASTLRHADANAVALVAVSAGPDLEHEAQRLWQNDRPDEYFFLEVYGSAVVELLTTMAGARLCQWANDHGFAVLPHSSPGYADWDVSEQRRLLDLLKRPGDAFPGPLDALESGMLRPKKSLLAVFGLTRNVERVRQLTELVPCANCSYPTCQFRRTPYIQPPASWQHELRLSSGGRSSHTAAAAPLNLDASYRVNAKALQRWSRERLSLSSLPNGTTEARFHYEGATCTNMGRSLAFDYTVRLGLREAGYPIQEQQCAPTVGHNGHTYMCGYIDDGDNLMRTIEHEKPLLGQRLDKVLSENWTSCSAGCYCDAPSRTHKWGLVLETIHYALAQQELNSRGDIVKESDAK